MGRSFAAARRDRREFPLRVISSRVGPVDATATFRVIRRFCEIGVLPSW